jgi:hypothetical protein
MSVTDNGTELASNAAESERERERERSVAKGNCTRDINLAQSGTRSAKAGPHRGTSRNRGSDNVGISAWN